MYEKNRNGVLEDEVKRMTRGLAEVRAYQERGVAIMQATRDAMAAKDVALREILALIKKLEKLKTSYNQTLLTRNAESSDLKVQLASEQERADDAEYERDGAKSRL